MCRIMEEILNEGLEKGREQGQLEEKLQMAENLLCDGIYTLERIIELTGLSDEDIRSILDRISDKQE